VLTHWGRQPVTLNPSERVLRHSSKRDGHQRLLWSAVLSPRWHLRYDQNCHDDQQNSHEGHAQIARRASLSQAARIVDSRKSEV
jgi:hypothetical protein